MNARSRSFAAPKGARLAAVVAGRYPFERLVG